MTESNVPAVVDERANVPARADTDSWITVAADVFRLAEHIAPTEFVPKSLRDSAPATAAAILYGREVGIPPMTALTQTHVIEGKPAMSAEGMRALIYASGHELVIEETTGAVCRMKGRRRGAEGWTTLQWTIDMARAAGVANKAVWKNYPRQMLQARCTTELARLVFPDVIHGFRSIEELDDLGEEESTAAASAAPVETTRVARTTKRPAAKKSAPPPRAERVEAPAGPPLPGEDGYDQAQTTDTEPTGPEPVAEVPPADDSGEGSTAGGPEDEITPERQPARAPAQANKGQLRMLFALLKPLEVGEDDRHEVVGTLLGRSVESFEQLTRQEASTLLDTLAHLEGDRAKLDTLLTEATRS